jgi:DNA polymerase I-like protein with 3'-5' exonuclease and polymerase domains
MEDFFSKKQIKKCQCTAEKGALFKYTYAEHFGNAVNKQNIDILILLEFKEVKTKLDIFLNLCNTFFNKLNYVIIPALGCTPNDFSTQDTINTYKKCKEYNINKIIKEYNPKCIITTGRAIYTITEAKDLQAPDFFISVNENLKEYEKDDSWFYSSEYNCKIFPIPALYQWIGDSIKDVYEYKFVIQQFKFAINSLQENKRRKIKYDLIFEKDSNKFIKELINNKNIKAIAIDTESSNLNYFEGTLYSIQFSYNGKSGHFCLFDQINKNLLIELFNRNDIKFIFHHAQHDLKFLKCNEIDNVRCDFDTMLCAHLLNENNPNGLKSLAWLYTELGGYDLKLKQYLKQYKVENFTKLPEQLLLEYACYDSIITYQLYEYFENRLNQEEPFIKNNFYNFIIPAIEMITDVEMTGVQIDLKYLNEYVERLKKHAIEIENEIYELAGYKFNLKSNKELSKVLRALPEFVTLSDKDGKQLLNKNGDLTLDKETLQRYAEESNLPFMKKIAEYNHITKEISQFGYELKQQEKNNKKCLFEIENDLEENDKGFLASMYKGRLHGGYKLHGTETGRMSGGGGLGSSINWQNMPKTKEFRKIFLPSKNMVMAFADYDAMEVCIFSQISGPGVLESLILENKDMHCYTAVKLMKLMGIETTYEEVYSKTKIDGQEDPIFVKWRTDSKGNNFQCLASKTRIKTNKGILNIEEIVPKINSGKFSKYTGDIKLLNRFGDTKEISHTIYKENCELLDVELEDGNTISITPDHEMLIIRDNIEIKILAKELRDEDDLVSI